jgi:hypothetical protein
MAGAVTLIQSDFQHALCISTQQGESMIRKLKSGEYRIFSRKKNKKTGKRRNLGTFPTLQAAKRHEREIQYFKRAH